MSDQFLMEDIEASFSEFQICEKKGKKKQNSKQVKVQLRKKWTLSQNNNYCDFLRRQAEILIKDQKKDKQRVYNRMAALIKTRSSRQCKSHHQKLLTKHKSIQNIVKAFESSESLENCEAKSNFSIQNGSERSLESPFGMILNNQQEARQINFNSIVNNSWSFFCKSQQTMVVEDVFDVLDLDSKKYHQNLYLIPSNKVLCHNF